MSATKAVIRQQEMPQEMLDYIVAKTIVAQEQFNSEKEIASFLKKEMQDMYHYFSSGRQQSISIGFCFCSISIVGITSTIALRRKLQRTHTTLHNSYQATWHVVIGRFFGSYVTHEKNCYCYFYVGQMGVLAWKTP